MIIGDDFNNQPLTEAQREALIDRMQTAWANLPPDQQNQIKPLLDDAHNQFSQLLTTGRAPDHHVRPILRLKSYLTNDYDGHVESLRARAAAAQAAGAPPAPATPPPPAAALQISVGPGGEILGTGKYEELDPLWELVAGTVWLENLLHRHPFPAGEPKTVDIPNQLTIALAGDFGTGNFGANDSPSTKISKFIPTLKPDITIHLGDVYYAGTSGEERDKLIPYWPKGSIASFAMNSNHEMYSGGGPYFNETVGGPMFNKLQSPFSFFALENANWIIVGLDSAYEANVLKLYMDGSIGKTQQPAFLRDIATRANKKKKVVILTHHEGLQEDGDPTHAKPLYGEVMNAFAGFDPPAYWYWGHVHAGVAYKPLDNGLRCRCAGHGALPWGQASLLKNSSHVEWYESRKANDPLNSLRVYNGFVFLQFKDATLSEAFYDETGNVAWQLP